MVTLLASLAMAGPITVKVPFPTSTMYDDQPDRVCLTVSGLHDVTPTVVDDGWFEASCGTADGRLEVCLTLLQPSWPKRVAPVVCEAVEGQLRVVPVRAFDPSEDVLDGVRILRTDVIQGTFRTPNLPDSPGILDGGGCGVREGHLWVKSSRSERHQRCTLVVDGEDLVIPILVVPKL